MIRAACGWDRPTCRGRPRRYIVSRCDNGDSCDRPHEWDVGYWAGPNDWRTYSTHRTRAEARAEARAINASATVAAACAVLGVGAFRR